MSTPDKFSSMRQSIIFQSESTSADSGGGTSLSWTNFATVWAEIKHTNASEKFVAGQIEDRADYVITTRYISGVTPKMRILFGSRIFNIRSVADVDERGEFLKIMAEEGVGV